MKKFILSTLLVSTLSGCAEPVREQSQIETFNGQQAWDELNTALASNYAYLEDSQVSSNHIFSTFAPQLIQATDRRTFIDTAQAMLRHFHDPHLNLGPYDLEDYSVYPTGSDIYAEFKSSHSLPVIVDVKAGSAAAEAGVRPGMIIKGINGVTVDSAITHVMRVSKEQLSWHQQRFALNIALGGKRYQPRTLLLTNGDHECLTIELAATYDAINALSDGPLVSHRQIGDVGYIRINNSLGNSDTSKAFKQALEALEGSQGWIIDLRNTPSGGNTGVAEPMMGHFVDKTTVYQTYQRQTETTSWQQAEKQQATASPQQPFIDKPFVVLAGRWTGSMGEGTTIGLDALGAKAIIGAPMADLLGGIQQIKLEESDAWIDIAYERLFHVDGTFREDFVPSIKLDAADLDQDGNDPALAKALALLQTR